MHYHGDLKLKTNILIKEIMSHKKKFWRIGFRTTDLANPSFKKANQMPYG
jgi:hypothetical protein